MGHFIALVESMDVNIWMIVGFLLAAYSVVALWDGPGNLAKTNADQVKRVRDILEGLSLEVATSDEAREMLALKGKDKTNI